MVEKIDLEYLIKNPNKISELKFEDISNIFQTLRKLFYDENIILEFNSDNNDEEIYVIGDIHGNLQSLLKLIEIINKKTPKWVIFLGDIVDRGSYQLECLILVLALKIIEPNKYYILKGNDRKISK